MLKRARHGQQVSAEMPETLRRPNEETCVFRTTREWATLCRNHRTRRIAHFTNKGGKRHGPQFLARKRPPLVDGRTAGDFEETESDQQRGGPAGFTPPCTLPERAEPARRSAGGKPRRLGPGGQAARPEKMRIKPPQSGGIGGQAHATSFRSNPRVRREFAVRRSHPSDFSARPIRSPRTTRKRPPNGHHRHGSEATADGRARWDRSWTG